MAASSSDAVARLMADFERFREAVTKCVDFTAPKVKSAAVAVDGCIRPIIVKAMEQPAEKPPHKNGASSSLLDKLDSPPLSPRLNATIAFEEAAFGAANDAEILRRQLIRTQTLCANQLYDVRLRCTLRLCFRALQKAGGAPPAAEAAPSDETPRRSRKLLGYDETLAPGEPAPLVPYGGSPDMTFLSPHQRRLLQDPFLLGLNGSAGGGMSGLRDGLSNRTSKSGGRYGITPTMAVALESAEHEERRDAQLYGFIQRFRTEKERLGTMASLQRVRTTARLCLHALRSHAAERVAWRGTKYGVALTAIMGNRTIVWTAFIAWRMDTRREAEKRHQTQEVVNVVQQRLLAAEGHFESLVDAQVRKRLSLRDKYVATRRHLWRERLLRICWLALRMWSYNQRMLDERQAWRDLFHNIKAGAAAAIKVYDGDGTAALPFRVVQGADAAMRSREPSPERAHPLLELSNQLRAEGKFSPDKSDAAAEAERRWLEDHQEQAFNGNGHGGGGGPLLYKEDWEPQTPGADFDAYESSPPPRSAAARHISPFG